MVPYKILKNKREKINNGDERILYINKGLRGGGREREEEMEREERGGRRWGEKRGV